MRESKVSSPRTQHNVPGLDSNPGPLDPESSALIKHQASPITVTVVAKGGEGNKCKTFLRGDNIRD